MVLRVGKRSEIRLKSEIFDPCLSMLVFLFACDDTAPLSESQNASLPIPFQNIQIKITLPMGKVCI